MAIMKLSALVVCGVALTGCATKRYPIATELSAVEKSDLTCRELGIELAKTDELELKIADTAETDWRSVAGFLGDYGIGNAMAKSEASKALVERRLSIKNARVEKSCDSSGKEVAEDIASSAVSDASN